jgi:hypothetical protein
MKPKINEYWYFTYGSVNSRIDFGKVVAIDENYILFYYNQQWSYPLGLQYIRVGINDAIGKWEPNQFFRLLGYK